MATSGSCACTRPAVAESPEGELSHLREENVRLANELTAVREEALKEKRLAQETCSKASGGETASNDENEGEVASESGAQEPAGQASDVELGRPRLPIVKLSPESAETKVALTDRSIEEWEAPVGTRPVLRVRGEHEAWVYHRRVQDDEPQQETDALPPSPSNQPATPPSESP